MQDGCVCLTLHSPCWRGCQKTLTCPAAAASSWRQQSASAVASLPPLAAVHQTSAPWRMAWCPSSAYRVRLGQSPISGFTSQGFDRLPVCSGLAVDDKDP